MLCSDSEAMIGVDDTAAYKDELSAIASVKHGLPPFQVTKRYDTTHIKSSLHETRTAFRT